MVSARFSKDDAQNFSIHASALGNPEFRAPTPNEKKLCRCLRQGIEDQACWTRHAASVMTAGPGRQKVRDHMLSGEDKGRLEKNVGPHDKCKSLLKQMQAAE
ncbi:unnamed protein product [Haemonchus placei]|uniref:Uncharacterized protein n=1 Tax=Haemonchus placei TaxID=6290 RepID=A0A0N4WHW2_HAEPC|nr:unnamed protein product [Haemonchus placei]